MVVALVVTVAALAGACSPGGEGADRAAGDRAGDQARPPAGPGTTPGPEGTDPPSPSAPGGGAGGDGAVAVLNTQGGNLDAYGPEPPFPSRRLVRAGPITADGPRVDGQVCVFPDGSRRVAVADRGGGAAATGWAILQLRGERIDELAAVEVGRLVSGPSPTPEGPQPYGCGFLSDGRLVTTDAGSPPGGPATGQLTLWFPPYSGEGGPRRSCRLDVGIAAAGGVWVDDQDRVYVASAGAPSAGVWRYSGPWPTSPAVDGGCDARDEVGHPRADRVRKELLIPAGEHDLAAPAAVTAGLGGHLFVSSTVNGVINEHDQNGTFLRTLIGPADPSGTAPAGHPFGLAVDPAGLVYYADVGTLGPAGAPPVAGTGSLRRVPSTRSDTAPPEVVARGLDAPRGVGLAVPPGGGAASKV